VRISDVLKNKSTGVTTVDPSATVQDLVALLAERNIGAVIVSSDGRTPAGMVSERDVVRQLNRQEGQLLGRTVGEIMTAEVVVCSPEEKVESVLQLMTERRFRHVPVMDEAKLVGIVSIGDLVKSQIDQLRLERDQLTNYISGYA
jgi:CBS domain-containing protein